MATGQEELIALSTGLNKDFYLNVALGLVDGVSFISKFGENPSMSTNDPAADVWGFGGPYVFSTTADIDTVSSSDDTNTQNVLVSGLDENWNDLSQMITLTGQTKVTLPVPLLRVYRMLNMGTTDLGGVVYCYVDGAITNGVPNTDADVRAVMNNGDNQTLMCIYTIPADKTGVFLQGYVAISRAITSVANMSWRARVNGGVFQVKSRLSISSAASGSWQYDYAIPIPLPEKTDVKITIETVSANSTGVSGGFELLLIDNDLYAEWLSRI